MPTLAEKLGLVIVGNAEIKRGAMEPLMPRTRNVKQANNWPTAFDDLKQPDLSDLENPLCDYFDAAGSPAELNKLRSAMNRCQKVTGKGFATRSVAGAVVMDGNNIVKQTVRFYRIR